MKVIKPSVVVEKKFDGHELLKDIERAGRTCYQSEWKITETSYLDFAKMLIVRKHETPLEHAHVSLRIVCDRGISHELVRHRLVSFCQQSTRYCNYSNERFGDEIQVIEPQFDCPEGKKLHVRAEWLTAMQEAERHYLKMVDSGASPQFARSVLPNSLKTEIVMTTNLREYRHILMLRCSLRAHPQMREIMFQALGILHQVPVLFDGLWEMYGEK